ncbi:MAG: S8 family serine peptidase [Pseudomonadota bacterium]
MLRYLTAVVAACGMAATSLASELTAPNPSQGLNGLVDVTPTQAGIGPMRTYIVQLPDAPGASYEGGVAGFAPTAPVAGQAYNADAPHVQAYTTRLVAQHDDVLASLGASDRKIYSYRHALNGFAARLTPGEAETLKRSGGIAAVWEDYAVDVDTNDTSDFLGLNDRREGLRAALGMTGEDVIIGVLDTGAIQEHPSFSDTPNLPVPEFCAAPSSRFQAYICSIIERANQRVIYKAPPAQWSGICQAGEAWTEDDCNNKMIGARWYVDGFLAGRGSVVEGEFLSPRDSSGHGSHTAGTAGGNKVTATLNGTPVGQLSGMAPRARLAIYKVCWLSPGATNFSCFFSDSAAATDAAVADGVDVLNFSVGTAASFTDQQDLAFFDASNAGVFIARSGGNSGPGFGTTNAGEPWVTTVAASTTDGVRFALGADINSPSSVAGVYEYVEGAITRPLADSGDVTADLGAASPIEACTPLDNDLTGKIALIARGSCSFVDKIENAANAGALAVLVYTNASAKVIMGGDATPLTQSIPGVMIDNGPGLALFAEVNGGSTVNASLNDTTFTELTRTGNIMASFSSRGPYLVEDDWVKPDITAPGVSILAPYTTEPADGSAGALYDYLSGTSMSGPHIAGIGALLRQAHPEWSPAQIKSAIMTTARQDVVKEDGATPADPFDFGAGHVDPNKAASPGLTYNAGELDYLVASCGTVTPLLTPADCAFVESVGFSTSPADLNLPSIGIGALPGSQTVTRTVTAVGAPANRKSSGLIGRFFPRTPAPAPTPTPTRYRAVIDAPEGFNVSVAPSEIVLTEGESASYALTVTNDTAIPNVWEFGSLTWEPDSGNAVRSPIAVKALAFITEDEVDGEGAQGSAQFDLTFGYSGEYTAQVHGLNSAAPIGFVNLLDDPDNSFAFSFSDPATFATVIDDVQPGTAFRRFALYNEYTTGNDDIDLYLYYCPGGQCTQIASSTNAGSDEEVSVLLPIPFDDVAFNPYVLFIHAFETEAADTTFIYYDSTFGIVDDAGNLSVDAPATATAGQTVPITVDWAGLPTGLLEKRLGAISHSDPNGIQNLTIIDIENDPGASICDFGICQ